MREGDLFGDLPGAIPAPGEDVRPPCDTALVILAAAAQRETGAAFPFPDGLAGDVDRAVQKLLRRGWLTERAIRNAYAPAWRIPRGRDPLTLAITDAGLSALNLEGEQWPTDRF